MQSEPQPTADDGQAPTVVHSVHKRHRVLVPLLATVGLLCILVSTVSVWIRDSALDSNTWANQSGQLLQSQNVRNVVSAYVADQAIIGSDAQARLAAALPPRLQPLAPAAAAGLNRFAADAIDRALTLPRVQELWMDANRRANERLVNFLKGDTNRLQASNGTVQLNLGAIVAEAARNVGASPSIAERAQRRVRPIVLVRSGQLGLAQDVVQWIGILSVWPLLAGLVLSGAAVYLGSDRRRTIVRGLAIGFLVMGVGLLAVRNIGGNLVVDSLVKTDSLKPAVHDVWTIYTSLLAESAAAGIAIGLLGLLWSWAAGPTLAAASVRRRLAPTFREQPLAPHIALALLALLVLVVQPVGTPRRTIGLVALVVLAFAGMELLRRQAVREFPDATSGVAAGVRGFFANRAGRAQAPEPAASDRVAQLERLAALHERGALSDAEYEQEKTLIRSA